MALRAARAYRQKDVIAKFEGNFHGQHESVLVSTLGVAGSGDSPDAHLDSAGIPHAIADDVIVLPYNKPDRAASLIAEHAHELGGVILEPVSAFGLGCVPASPGFLAAVREVTAEHDIPLIFDEVVTNFRLALGGAAEYFGVKPDLVCLGKILGGGFPIGGYGGRRDIMEKVVTPKVGLWDLSEQIFQSGCFSGNPLSMTAGLAALEELEKGMILPYANGLAAKLREGMEKIAAQLSADLLVTGAASMFQIHFGVDKIRDKRDALQADKEAAEQFHLGLRSKGVMASAHPLFLSAAHREEHLQIFLEVSEHVLRTMAKEGII
jgi:glutamate-1-semialdehyde 2,1-aminomutase